MTRTRQRKHVHVWIDDGPPVRPLPLGYTGRHETCDCGAARFVLFDHHGRMVEIFDDRPRRRSRPDPEDHMGGWWAQDDEVEPS